MKFIPLGFIASLVASASARSIYVNQNTLNRRSSLVDASGNTVVLDHTVSNSLNGLRVTDNANHFTTLVLDSEQQSARRPGSEAATEIYEDLHGEIRKRSLIGASCNRVIAKNTVSDVANGAKVTGNLNHLTAHVLNKRSSGVIDASGNGVSLKETVSRVGGGISATNNLNNAVARVINTRDAVGVKGTHVRASDNMNTTGSDSHLHKRKSGGIVLIDDVNDDTSDTYNSAISDSDANSYARVNSGSSAGAGAYPRASLRGSAAAASSGRAKSRGSGGSGAAAAAAASASASAGRVKLPGSGRAKSRGSGGSGGGSAAAASYPGENSSGSGAAAAAAASASASAGRVKLPGSGRAKSRGSGGSGGGSAAAASYPGENSSGSGAAAAAAASASASAGRVKLPGSGRRGYYRPGSRSPASATSSTLEGLVNKVAATTDYAIKSLGDAGAAISNDIVNLDGTVTFNKRNTVDAKGTPIRASENNPDIQAGTRLHKRRFGKHLIQENTNLATGATAFTLRNVGGTK